MAGLMVLSMSSNFAILIIFAITLCFVPTLESFSEFVANKAQFSTDLAYFWSAQSLSILSISLSVVFTCHNAFFEVFDGTGVPRDTTNYISIIYTTGACDFVQTAVVFIYPALMGFFHARSIAESVIWNTRSDLLGPDGVIENHS